MAAGYDAGWMPGDAYDALRAADFLRFCEAAVADPAARVPTCPEWDVTALCDHLARVYQGRTHAIEHGAFLERDRFETRADGADPLDFVRAWSDALDRSLLDRDDDAPTVTFMPEATTVHFWRRRMALETLVHRTDAEIAVGEVSPMDDELSADGVDELLWFCTHPDNDHHDGVTATTVVELTDGTRRWASTLTDGGFTAASTAPPDATVRGSAPAILLALSGRDLEGIGPSRFGMDLPVVDGDPLAYERLRTRLGAF
ncbi:MAG TPA: maleylpyruvate isomerase family mycothiol-dependent enzyme [Acidimicrobiales bacterium]|nr:maleylpyruvate isomerase family mycothiol-dependent enzyme [Acidimicrobiales bacterium]